MSNDMQKLNINVKGIRSAELAKDSSDGEYVTEVYITRDNPSEDLLLVELVTEVVELPLDVVDPDEESEVVYIVRSILNVGFPMSTSDGGANVDWEFPREPEVEEDSMAFDTFDEADMRARELDGRWCAEWIERGLIPLNVFV